MGGDQPGSLPGCYQVSSAQFVEARLVPGLCSGQPQVLLGVLAPSALCRQHSRARACGARDGAE